MFTTRSYSQIGEGNTTPGFGRDTKGTHQAYERQLADDSEQEIPRPCGRRDVQAVIRETGGEEAGGSTSARTDPATFGGLPWVGTGGAGHGARGRNEG